MAKVRASRSRAAVITVAIVVLFASACSSSTSHARGSKLMTQTARAGTWTAKGDAYELTLRDVSPVTVVFTDRPQRKATTITTQSLVDNWKKAFGDDPPNAAVQLTGGDDDQVTAVVTLRDPVYSAAGDTLTYDATLIGDAANAGNGLAEFTAAANQLPRSFDAVSVFIDGTNVSIPSGDDEMTAASPPVKCEKQGSPGGAPLKMSIVNHSAYPDEQVYVALTGNNVAQHPDWDANPRDLINTSVPLSCLPKDTTVPGGHAYSFELGEWISAGLLWISLGSPITSGLPDTQPSFDTTPYRFANVEFAYPGQGDMTNVDQFSFPVDLETYASGSGTVAESARYRANTCAIVKALKTAVDSRADNGAKWKQVVVTDPQGKFARVVSPKQRAKQLDKNGQNANPYAQGWPSLEPYLRTMANKTVVVKGLFTPGTSSSYYDETGWYSYTAKFDKDSNVTMTGTIGAAVANGPGGTGARAGSPLTISATGTDTASGGTVVGNDSLLTGLYDQSSRYSVAGQARNGMTNGVTELAAPDDVYNSIYRDFVTAFTYGYWGGVYGDDNTEFWRSFAPPAAPAGGKPAFLAARPEKEPARLLPFNLWSKTMFEFSDDYNIPYGEDYGSGAPDRPSPLLDVPAGGTWRMIIGPDGETGCLDGD